MTEQKTIPAALAIALLRDTLQSAKYAIKGREHTGFIDNALEATANIEQPSQPKIPDGWKLVPIEPTYEYCAPDCNGECSCRKFGADPTYCDNAIAAAPTPKETL